eukprot:228450-Chlamydomonas_euryale.AAC.2
MPTSADSGPPNMLRLEPSLLQLVHDSNTRSVGCARWNTSCRELPYGIRTSYENKCGSNGGTTSDGTHAPTSGENDASAMPTSDVDSLPFTLPPSSPPPTLPGGLAVPGGHVPSGDPNTNAATSPGWGATLQLDPAASSSPSRTSAVAGSAASAPGAMDSASCFEGLLGDPDHKPDVLANAASTMCSHADMLGQPVGPARA